jgi:type IV fimbrial biogenesis protein FimT
MSTIACTRPLRGLGLPEVLITLVLVTIVAKAGVAHLHDFKQVRQLRAASADWSRVTMSARQWAFAHHQNVRLELVGIGGTCLVLHTGSRGDCAGCAEEMACKAGTRLLDRTAPLPPMLQGTATSTSLIWNPGDRTVSPTGTLKLSLPDGRAIHHVVNLVGRLRLCSPGGLVGGLPPC